MLNLSVKIGQAVRIGDGTVIRVTERRGSGVCLTIFSDERPISVVKEARTLEAIIRKPETRILIDLPLEPACGLEPAPTAAEALARAAGRR